jgi:hypothetical protein
MAKTTTGYLCALALACVVVSGCDNGTTGPDDCDPEQIIFAWAQHAAGYWDERSDYVEEPITWMNGFVLADPVPVLQHVTINEQSFSGNEIAFYDFGYAYFGYFNSNELAIYSDFDPISVAIGTSAGQVEGTLALPDTIASLASSEQSIELGESLTISWDGSSADFYTVWLDYEYVASESLGLHWTSKDTVVSGESATIDGSFFAHDGVIRFIEVTPTNGPFPEAGAHSNMSGSGRGFLYYASRWQSFPVGITVGAGLPRLEADRHRIHSREGKLGAGQLIAERLIQCGAVE